MKFGIYVDLTTIKTESPISKHSEWAFKRADGKDWTVEGQGGKGASPDSRDAVSREGQEGKGQEVTAERGEALHEDNPLAPFGKGEAERSEQAKIFCAKPKACVVFCIASDYGVYAAQALADLIESLDETVGYQGDRPSVVLDYIILDMPTIGSAEQSIYGCAAYGHGHYSRPESLWKIYESIFEIADFLHQKFPDLVICISPKTYGTQIPDFALLPHIDQFLVFSGEGHPKVSNLTNFLPRNLLLKVWSEF